MKMDTKRGDPWHRLETLKTIYPRIVTPIALAAAIFFGVLAWLDAGEFHVLVGDDLRGFFTASQGFKAYYDLLVSVFRFRPVAALFIWGGAKLSSGQFQQLLLIGAGLHTFNAFLFWGLLRKALRVTPGIALSLTLVATFNRFIAYFLTPELAIIEGAATAFYLLFLWALLRLLATPRQSLATLVGVLFLIVLHVHERYMVLAAGSLAVAIMIYRRNRGASFITAGTTFVALAFNFCFKKLFLFAPILMGTTTQAIEFKPRQIGDFVADGLLNLMGINRGPSYLSVLDYIESPGWLKLVSLACAAFALVILVCGVRGVHETHELSSSSTKVSWMPALLLVGLVLALVLSGSITFRQEYRWLYPAYLTFLALLGFSVRLCSNLPSRLTATVSLAAFCLLAIPREFAIREHRDNYYARGAYRTGNDLYLVLEHSPSLLKRERVAIGGGAVPDLSWSFMGDVFSRNYKLPALYFIPEPASGAPPAASEISFIQYDQALREFTFAASDDRRNNIDNLATAKVVSPETGTLSTPNGKPSFAFSSPGFRGWGLVSPVTVEVEVPKASRTLNVSFSHVWAQGDGLNLLLTAYLSEGQTTELIATEVKPLQDNARPNWRTFRVSLPENCPRLRLSLRSGTGDGTADWLCFRDFTFE
jgi:hypothetical protein